MRVQKKLHGRVQVGVKARQSLIRQRCERKDPRNEKSKDKEGGLCPPGSLQTIGGSQSEAERSVEDRLNARARDHGVLRMPWHFLESFGAGHGMTSLCQLQVTANI